MISLKNIKKTNFREMSLHTIHDIYQLSNVEVNPSDLNLSNKSHYRLRANGKAVGTL